MRLKCFTIPALDPAEATEDLNRFLANQRVLTIDRNFVADGPGSFWAIAVTYQDKSAGPSSSKRTRVDYRELLSEEDFATYARLRELRKTLAQREGVPPYAIFTNEQLATIVRERVSSSQSLAAIPGVGPARVEKYGPAFLELLTELRTATSPTERTDAPS